MNVDHSVCQRTAAVDPTPAYFKTAKQYRKILKKKKGCTIYSHRFLLARGFRIAYSRWLIYYKITKTEVRETVHFMIFYRLMKEKTIDHCTDQSMDVSLAVQHFTERSKNTKVVLFFPTKCITVFGLNVIP